METQLELAKKLNSDLWAKINQCKSNHEINNERAENMQRHLNETNNVIREYEI